MRLLTRELRLACGLLSRRDGGGVVGHGERWAHNSRVLCSLSDKRREGVWGRKTGGIDRYSIQMRTFVLFRRFATGGTLVGKLNGGDRSTREDSVSVSGVW